MVKKFLSTMMAAAMVTSVLPGVFAEETYTDIKEIHVDLTSHLNSDFIGLTGDSSAVENFMVNNNAVLWNHGIMLDGRNISSAEDGIISVNRRYSQITTQEGGSTTNEWVETEDTTTFKMKQESASAGQLDAITIDNEDVTYTVPLSGRPVDEIDFLTFCYGNHLGVIINYKDGTQKSYQELRGVGNDFGMYASSIPYGGANSESLAFITKTDDGDFVTSEKTGAIGGYGFPGQYLMVSKDGTLKSHSTVYNEEIESSGSSEIKSPDQTIGAFAIAVAVDPENPVESITFNNYGTKDKVAVLAVTEATLSNEEMLNYINGIDLSNPVANAQKLAVAKNYITELTTYRGYSESQFADVLQAAEEAAWYAEGYDLKYDKLDIFDNSYELSDFLGSLGETPIKSEWAAGGKFTFSTYAVDSEYTTTGEAAGAGYRVDHFGDAKATGIFKINEIAAKGTDNGWNAPATGNEIEFYLPVEGQAGGVPDSVVISDTQNTQGVTIPAGNKNVDELYFFAPIWKGTVSVILNYTDGTVENLSTASFNQNFASCWSDGNFNNRAYKVWNDDQTEYAVNANKIGLAGQFGTFSNQYLVIGTEGKLVNAKDVCENKNNQTLGISAFGVDVDERKKLESITFPATNGLALLAVSTRVKTNEEMLSFINGIDLDAEPASIVADLELAMDYIEELEIRHIAKPEEFADVITAYEEAQWYADGVDGGEKQIDISSYFNGDLIGEVGQKYNPDSILGLDDNTKILTGDVIKNNAGILTMTERYATADPDGWQDMDSKFSMNIPLAGTDAGVNDSIVMSNSINPEGITIDIDDEAVEFIRLALDAGDAMSPQICINYTDGTSDEVTLKAHRMASIVYDANRAGRAYYNLSEDGQTVSEAVNGGVISWYNTSAAYADESTGTIAASASGTYGIFVNKIKADKSKITDSITIKPNHTKAFGIVAMNIVTISNDELMSVIDEADEIGNTSGYITTEEEAELVQSAAEYIKLLDRRHIRKLDDEANNNILGLSKQVKYAKGSYMDLSPYLNSDIIVADGDEIPEVYESERTLFYKGTLVPTDGIITMVKQTSPDIVEDDPETGRVFKLNGEYTKVGNDSIKVAKDGAEFTLPLSDVTSYTDMAFIIDALWASNGAGGGSSKINAVINYKDGSSEDVELSVWTADGFYVPQFFAHSHVNFQRTVANTQTGLYENEPIVSGKNSTNMFSSSMSLDINKQAQSITFKPSASGDYYILAGSANYVSTDDMVNTMYAYFDLGLASASEVNAENAATVAAGAAALIDLYENRGFDTIEGWFTAEDYELAKIMYNTAKAYEGIEDNVLTFVPSIEVKNGTMEATFVMTNTKDYSQSYVLIAAVYGENDKLLAINCSEEGVLEPSVVDVKTVSVEAPEGAVSYRAFVWDGMDTMVPISDIEQ